MILAHDERATAIEADLREPEAILGHPEVGRLIDFERPVGLLLMAVLPFIRDEEQPHDLVKRFARDLAPGSYLTISHGTVDGLSASAADAVQALYARATAPANPRSRADILALFDGFDLVEPGLVFLPQRRPRGPASQTVVVVVHTPRFGGMPRRRMPVFGERKFPRETGA